MLFYLGAQIRAFAVWNCCADHWVTDILQLEPSHNIKKVYFANNTLLHPIATHSLTHNTLPTLEKTKLHILCLPPLLFYKVLIISKMRSFVSWETVAYHQMGV